MIVDIIKDWWEFVIFVFLAVTGVFRWVLGIQRDVADIKSKEYMTESRCVDKRGNCQGRNKLQFDTGDAHFTRLEKMLAEERQRNEDRHNELMRILLEMNKQ